MKKIIFSLFLFLSIHAIAQQAPIAIVSTSGATKLTTTLDSAAILAQDNDIIYLPGGTLTGSNGTIWFTKKVTVIGVGHNMDSTTATGRTFIDGYVGFYIGSDGSVLDGVYVSQIVYIGANIKIYRSNVDQIVCSAGWPTANNLLVEKCVIRSHLYGSANAITNSIISNSVLSGDNYCTGVYTTTYENNVFLISNGGQFTNSSQCTFRNNTFTGISDWGTSPLNHFFYNNVFATASLPPLSNSGNASGNFLNQSPTGTFSVSPTTSYTYANDYIINSSSPGKNGGTDGKDVGIYGGSTPWAKGNIPPNPHIRTKNVDATTGAGGTLRVRFNVSTQ